MSDASILEINLTAMATNMRVIRDIVGEDCHLCPVIKADAYGLGAGRIGRHLTMCGARMLAVYSPEQAAELLGKAVSGDVLILMPLRQISREEQLYRGLVSGRLHLTGHDPAHIEALARLADRYGARIPVHVEVDTGMHRGGCTAVEAGEMLVRLKQHPRLRLAGLFTHFANSNIAAEHTQRQIERFDEFLEQFDAFIEPDCLVHQASTLPTLQDSRLHRTMVRFGLGWAGYGPELLNEHACVRTAFGLQPILTWSSQLVQVRSIDAGESVGYGGRWTSTRPTRLGVIPAGYADGYPTALAGTDDRGIRAHISVLEETPDGTIRHPAPVVGAISMDQMMVDLTDVPSARLGTAVELITADRGAPNHLPKLARAIDVVPHEIMCGLNPRIRRVYHAHPTVEVETRSVAATAVAG